MGDRDPLKIKSVEVSKRYMDQQIKRTGGMGTHLDRRNFGFAQGGYTSFWHTICAVTEENFLVVFSGRIQLESFDIH